MGATSIEWTDQTWNPVVGCTRISPGCKACYAFALHDMRHAAYLRGKNVPNQYAKPFNEIQLMPERLADPLSWRRSRMIFVNSMSDLFHKDVPDEFITAVFGVMTASPQHTYQVLTKRAERLRRWAEAIRNTGGLGPYIRSDAGRKALRSLFDAVAKFETVNGKQERTLRDPWMQVMNGAACFSSPQPIFNAWLGVSVENPDYAERIEHLRNTPAAVRFVSVEPMLYPLYEVDWTGIHWVIIGVESNGAKVGRLGTFHTETDWMNAVIITLAKLRKCGVAAFVKQVPINGRVSHDPAEWPKSLRVRQMPGAKS